MNARYLAGAAAVLLSALALSGCVTALKFDSPTQGRKLLDLENSRRTGTITEAGYQKQRAEILTPAAR